MSKKILSPFVLLLATGPLRAETLQVVTSSSVLGKGSFGEFLQGEFPNFCKGCSVNFQSTNEISGLMGQLRQEKKKKKYHSFDAVLGLDSRHYQLASREGLIKDGVPYDQSSMAFIVDTKKLPEQEWPKSWSELPKRLNDSVLISDPRLSSPGFAWLLSIFGLQLQDIGSSKKLVHRIFPSWSSAYSAFTKGEGKAVWSYQSSEAYHRCNEKTDEEKKRYRALPLKEGYPMQVEHFALASHSTSKLAKKFSEFLLSEKVQRAVPEKNWMFPVVATTPLPDCFKQLTPFKPAKDKVDFSPEDLQSWTDQWAL